MHSRTLDAYPGTTGGATGQTGTCTTIAHDTLSQPLDRVNRQFHAERPNQLWGSRLHLCFDLAGPAVYGFRHFFHSPFAVNRSPPL